MRKALMATNVSGHVQDEISVNEIDSKCTAIRMMTTNGCRHFLLPSLASASVSMTHQTVFPIETYVTCIALIVLHLML